MYIQGSKWSILCSWRRRFFLTTRILIQIWTIGQQTILEIFFGLDQNEADLDKDEADLDKNEADLDRVGVDLKKLSRSSYTSKSV